MMDSQITLPVIVLSDNERTSVCCVFCGLKRCELGIRVRSPTLSQLFGLHDACKKRYESRGSGMYALNLKQEKKVK